jgi:hypothetical protein
MISARKHSASSHEKCRLRERGVVPPTSNGVRVRVGDAATHHRILEVLLSLLGLAPEHAESDGFVVSVKMERLEYDSV